MTNPHVWTVSRLGHGERMCSYCLGTNRELAVLGQLGHCSDAPPQDQQAMPDCPACYGAGVIYRLKGHDGRGALFPCDACHGTGQPNAG